MIRTYSHSDYGCVLKVYAAVEKVSPWIKLLPFGTSERYVHSEIEKVIASPKSCFLVSLQGESITGFVQAQQFKTFVEQEVPHLAHLLQQYGDGTYVRNILVRPEQWKENIGKQLLVEVKRQGSAQFLVTRTHPDNSRGIKFFEKTGFREMFKDEFAARVYFSNL